MRIVLTTRMEIMKDNHDDDEDEDEHEDGDENECEHYGR